MKIQIKCRVFIKRWSRLWLMEGMLGDKISLFRTLFWKIWIRLGRLGYDFASKISTYHLSLIIYQLPVASFQLRVVSCKLSTISFQQVPTQNAAFLAHYSVNPFRLPRPHNSSPHTLIPSHKSVHISVLHVWQLNDALFQVFSNIQVLSPWLTSSFLH